MTVLKLVEEETGMLARMAATAATAAMITIMITLVVVMVMLPLLMLLLLRFKDANGKLRASELASYREMMLLLLLLQFDVRPRAG